MWSGRPAESPLTWLKLLLKQTALKRCIVIAIRWNRDEISRGSSVTGDSVAKLWKKWKAFDVDWVHSFKGKRGKAVTVWKISVFGRFTQSSGFSCRTGQRWRCSNVWNSSSVCDIPGCASALTPRNKNKEYYYYYFFLITLGTLFSRA